jgi:hypothetical protein
VGTARPSRLKQAVSPDDQFWVSATKVEALFGLGRRAEADRLRAAIIAADPPPTSWMVQTMDEQLAKLEQLLQ